MGQTWVLPAPYGPHVWPHEPCYEGVYGLSHWSLRDVMVIKSPRSGVTLCFQFDCARPPCPPPPPPPQRLLPLMWKPFLPNHTYLGQKKYGSEKCTGWPFRDRDPMSRLWHWLTKIAWLHDKVRTTHPVTTKLDRIIPLPMLITLFNLGAILLEIFLANFLKNIRMCFSRSDALLDISQEWLVRLMWHEKEVYHLDTGYTMWQWPLTSRMTFTLDVSKSNFEITLSQQLWSDWCEM